ncbi:MAG: HlyD family efflux transporter periplasmic adaptor subunit [Bacteroidetes bacterium]|nr:HlyD family efflux transporter periplasmic adaptor subunit [Bacteroidota bacterium]
MLGLSKKSVEHLMPTDQLYSLRALSTPKAGRVLARWFLAIGIVFLIVLFLPWQQNIRGKGAVTTLSPANRPQAVETAIAGRIAEWRVREGTHVNKGDTILRLSEIKEKYFDPQMLERLQQQLDAKNKSSRSKEEKTKALQRQITALQEQLQGKLEQSKTKLEAEKFKFQNAENLHDRNKKLYELGNIPLTKFQEIEYKYQSSKAEYLNAQIEVQRIQAEYLDKINKAESELNSTFADFYETQAEVSKMQNENANMQIRNGQYQVIAPQSGIVVKTLKAGIGETIKEGEAICTIMPETTDLAVALYVKAMDVPLITRGRKVRIQFDGWPALQFSGWPSVSVGTFGGVVEVIDYVNSKPGEFRILVVPDQAQEAWPKQLRMGSGIKGWVMLNNVPVWYELWRQLNGFPASIYEEPEHPMEEVKKAKEK